MNPVTLAPPKGTRFHVAVSAGSSDVRPPLGEYTDAIFRQNRREELLLQKRLRVIDRHRSMASYVLRKSTEQTEHLQDSVALNRSPTLYEYDRWRASQRPTVVYVAKAAGKSGVVSETTRKSDGIASKKQPFAQGQDTSGKRQATQQQWQRGNAGPSNSVIAVTVTVPAGYRK